MGQSPRPWQVGDVVNGYRWNGQGWVPDIPPPTPIPTFTRPQPPPAGRPPVWLLVILAVVVGAFMLSVLNRPGSPPVVDPTSSGDTRTAGTGGEYDAVISGVTAIARGCSAFAGASGSGPGVDDVGPSGAVASFVVPWPTNPYTGLPMTSGNQPGDFTFHTAIHMPDDTYTGYVYGHLDNGQDFSVEFRY